MNSLGPVSPDFNTASVALPQRRVLSTRLVDYAQLAKPRIAVMALVTVVVGYTLAAGDGWQWLRLVNALVGIGLAAVASGALNQYLERHSDRLMSRTADRPLPADRLAATEVGLVGLVSAIAGLTWLVVLVNPATESII